MQHLSQEQLSRLHGNATIIKGDELATYIGDIDMDAIQNIFEEAFERLIQSGTPQISFEQYIEKGNQFVKDVMTAHPTFFLSKNVSGFLSQYATACAMNDQAQIEKLKPKIRKSLRENPYKDPTTDQEGEMIHEALINTIKPGQMMQRAMIKKAQQHHPDRWKEGQYSPYGRATWQKFDRDGRVIPMNIQMAESIRMRRMGLECIHLPRLQELQKNPEFQGLAADIKNIVTQIEQTIELYKNYEERLDGLNTENLDMDALQAIIDDIESTKTQRITHPDHITQPLETILTQKGISDALFTDIKLIIDDLQMNGLCLGEPTHRIGAKDVHSYLNVQRQKKGVSDLKNADNIRADQSHFQETETMIAEASDQVSGSFTGYLKSEVMNGETVREMMMVRRFVANNIDSHTFERVDIAECHNAMTQRALRLAAIQHGVSDHLAIGILHEDAEGSDNGPVIYRRLFGSKLYLDETNRAAAGTNKKPGTIHTKVGFSDFAKQQGVTGTKPNTEAFLLKSLKVMAENDIKVWDIEFAGGQGPGRRVNPMGYDETLKETITPSVLAYASKLGIHIRARETIQGGDGCLVLGTEQSAAKTMATKLDHMTRGLTDDPNENLDWKYYKELSEEIIGHSEDSREEYKGLYEDPDIAILIKLFKNLSVKGGSRKVDRGEERSPYDKPEEASSLIADIRAIGFNYITKTMGVHLAPILGVGTAFYNNPQRTEKIIESPLFRERLATAFMVRDLHMTDQLRDTIEIFNPDYWRDNFPQFDDGGKRTTECAISKRLDEVRHPDAPDENLYSVLSRAVRKIDRDLEKFDEVRRRHQDKFADVEAKIAQGNYKERVKTKRRLLKKAHESRIGILKKLLIKAEGSNVLSTNYKREQRSNAIKAAMCLDFAQAGKIFGADDLEAVNDNLGDETIDELVDMVKEHGLAINHLTFAA